MCTVVEGPVFWGVTNFLPLLYMAHMDAGTSTYRGEQPASNRRSVLMVKGDRELKSAWKRLLNDGVLQSLRMEGSNLSEFSKVCGGSYLSEF